MRLYLTPSPHKKKTTDYPPKSHQLHKFTNSISFNNNAPILSANAIKVTHQVRFAVFVGGNNANIAAGAWPGLPQLAGSSLAEIIFKPHMLA